MMPDFVAGPARGGHLLPEILLFYAFFFKAGVDEAPGLGAGLEAAEGDFQGHGGRSLAEAGEEAGIRGDAALAPAEGHEADVGALLLQGHELDVFVRDPFRGVELERGSLLHPRPQKKATPPKVPATEAVEGVTAGVRFADLFDGVVNLLFMASPISRSNGSLNYSLSPAAFATTFFPAFFRS